VHAPLGPERLHVLTQHEQYHPIGPGPSDGAGGPRSGRGVARRLRARLSRDFYGGDAQIAKPTEAEYKEITGGH
jgi:ubiquinol-cytochrome c reductase cytochrome b subunit